MDINAFLQQYRRVVCGDLNVTRPRVRCADGFTVSVQAGYGLYSMPRKDADHYEKVELGYPSDVEHDILAYAESPEYPTDTVYSYVPVDVVDRMLEKHGGIVGADFSNDQAGLWKESCTCP